MTEGMEKEQQNHPKETEKKMEQGGRNPSEVWIDCPLPYQETYQMKMLMHNQIPGLFQVRGCGREGASRYYIQTENAQSLEDAYRNRDLGKEEILEITRQILKVTEQIKDYLLDPDGLLLSEDYVFEKNGAFYFCFLPVQEKSWYLSYHELTEYFVRKVDYKDTESVLLACMLHKETLKDTYDLELILSQYEEEARSREEHQKQQERRTEHERKGRTRMEREEDMELLQEDGEEFPETMIIHLDQEKQQYNRTSDHLAVMEEKRYGPLKKFAKRLKSGRWGEWEDLITEADDYDRPV